MRSILPLLVFLFALLVLGVWLYQQSLPKWQLSTTNTPAWLLVEVFSGDESQPTFTHTINGAALPRDMHRVTRLTLPNDLGQTVFYDETCGPGRWTIRLGQTTLDILPGYLLLEDGTEIAPMK